MSKPMLVSHKYDMPLTDWIVIGLNQHNLERTAEIIRADQPPKGLQDMIKGKRRNSEYLEKILREEIVKQFPKPDRPLVEIVLNSIDAKPEKAKANTADYVVDVRLKKHRFSCQDHGLSMSLDEILKFLIIPFSTQKNPLENIGRFGVGFFSALNYCLNEPNRASVMVKTNNGDESYILRFYATGRAVKDLRMRVKKISPKKKTGTYVQISKKINILNAAHYISEDIEHVPPYIARIRINKKSANESKYSKWYFKDVTMQAHGQTVSQEVGLKFSQDISKINLASQGVKVKSFPTIWGKGVTVSFPPAVEVVEGRDDFKIDDNYKLCMNASFEILEQAIENLAKEGEDKKSEKREFLLNLIPSLLSAYQFNRLDQIPNIQALRDKLLPGKKYALGEDAYKFYQPFFSSSVMGQCFPVSAASLAYWHELCKGESELLTEHIALKQEIAPSEITRGSITDRMHAIEIDSYGQYPNLQPILLGINDQVKHKIQFVETKEHGASPFMVKDRVLYINLAHEKVQGPFDEKSIYYLVRDICQKKEIFKEIYVRNADDMERMVSTFIDYVAKVPVEIGHLNTLRRLKAREEAEWKKRCEEWDPQKTTYEPTSNNPASNGM